MTITISGRNGEGKTCIANIVRQALEDAGVMPSGFGPGEIPYFESMVAVDMLNERLVIQIVEENR